MHEAQIMRRVQLALKGVVLLFMFLFAFWCLFLGRTNSSYCHSTRASSRRHQPCLLIVRISLQKPTSRASPSAQTHGQSSRSISLAHFHCFLDLLERCCKALSVCRLLHTAPTCVNDGSSSRHVIFDYVVPSLHTLEVCLALSRT